MLKSHLATGAAAPLLTLCNTDCRAAGAAAPVLTLCSADCRAAGANTASPALPRPRSALGEELQLERAAADAGRLDGHHDRPVAVARRRRPGRPRLTLHPGEHGQGAALRGIRHHLKRAACTDSSKAGLCSGTSLCRLTRWRSWNAPAAWWMWEASETQKVSSSTLRAQDTQELARQGLMASSVASAPEHDRGGPLRAGLRHASANCSFSRQPRSAASTSSTSSDARISRWHCRGTHA